MAGFVSHKTILLTGAHGFLGRHLAPALGVGTTVLAPTRHELDLTDAAAVDTYFTAHPIHLVVHCAALGGHRHRPDASAIVDFNLRMFHNLVRHHHVGCPLISFGSGAEYAKHRGVTADTPFGVLPRDYYGFSKFCQRMFAVGKPYLTEVCPFGVYGPGEDWTTRFLSQMILAYIRHEPLEIQQDRVMSFVWIGDLVRLVVDVATQYLTGDPPPHRIYHAVPATPTRLSDLAAAVNMLSNYQVPIRIVTPGDGVPYWYSPGAAARWFTTPIGAGLRRLYRYYQTTPLSLPAHVVPATWGDA